MLEVPFIFYDTNTSMREYVVSYVRVVKVKIDKIHRSTPCILASTTLEYEYIPLVPLVHLVDSSTYILYDKTQATHDRDLPRRERCWATRRWGPSEATSFVRAMSAAWPRQSMPSGRTRVSFSAESRRNLLFLRRRGAARLRGLLRVSRFPKASTLLFSAAGRTRTFAASAPLGLLDCTGDCHGCGWDACLFVCSLPRCHACMNACAVETM